MALSTNFNVIPNQSTEFTGNSVDCASNELTYKNIVNADDITQIQFEINPSDLAVDLFRNGDFTTGSSGWTLVNMIHSSLLGAIGSTSNSACSASITPNSLQMPFGENAFMKVDVFLIANTAGCDITVGTRLYSLQAGQIGLFTFYGILGDNTATNKLIKIESYGGTDHSFICSYVHATPIDYNYVFLVRNTTTNVVEVAYEFWQYFSFVYYGGTSIFRVVDNIITWSLDWSDLGLTNGCYQLEVCDPNLNVNLQCGFPNQDFNYLEENVVSYDGGNILATFNGDSKISLLHFAGVAGTFQILTDVSPVTGITYNYTAVFTDVDLSGGGITMTIGFTGDNDSVPITTAGTYSGSFTSDGGACFFNIIMSSNASCKVGLARLYLADDQDFAGDYISNGFKLTDGECNTVVLHGCSDTDYAFGFNFGTSDYKLRGRLEGKWSVPQYKFDRSTFEFDENANVRTAYFKRAKTRVLKLNIVPEYMMDFLTALVGMDHIYVDNVEYNTAGDEFITIQDSGELNNFGYITLYLNERNTTIEKVATVEVGIGCSDTINCILDPEDDTCLIDPETGDELILL